MRLLRELWGFVSFLVSLWGLLAGVSVALPLANSWWSALPLQEAYFRLATGLATLTCFFALLYSFAERHRLRSALRAARNAPLGWEPEANALHAARGRFGWCLASLALYLILDVVYERLSGQRGDLQELAVRFISPLAAIFYSLLFGLLTAAFGELAVIEFVKEQMDEKLAPTAK